MATPTLQEFVSSYGNEKGLDVSSIVQDSTLGATQPMQDMQEEMPVPDFRSHVEQMIPMLRQMTEGEMMEFIFNLIGEYTRISNEGLEGVTQPESEYLSNY